MVGPMDGGAFEVSVAVDGRRQLRNDWLLLLHHCLLYTSDAADE